MTPAKSGKKTIIKIEKVRRQQLDETKVQHKAGGQHAGLVINKQADSGWSLLKRSICCGVFRADSYHSLPLSSI